MSRPAVFLDRDGVLNAAEVVDGRPYPPDDLSRFRLLPGVAEAVRALDEAGFVLVVVTNQPDIGRGTRTRAEVDAINQRLQVDLPALAEVVVCAHDDRDDCACRKPRPGMLTDAATRLDLDLEQSFMVGDRWRDIEAGQRAGVRTVHIQCNYDERQPAGVDVTVTSLLEAVPHIQRLINETSPQGAA